MVFKGTFHVILSDPKFETINIKYIEKIHPISNSSLSDNGMLQIFSFFN